MATKPNAIMAATYQPQEIGGSGIPPASQPVDDGFNIMMPALVIAVVLSIFMGNFFGTQPRGQTPWTFVKDKNVAGLTFMLALPAAVVGMLYYEYRTSQPRNNIQMPIAQ